MGPARTANPMDAGIAITILKRIAVPVLSMISVLLPLLIAAASAGMIEEPIDEAIAVGT